MNTLATSVIGIIIHIHIQYYTYTIRYDTIQYYTYDIHNILYKTIHILKMYYTIYYTIHIYNTKHLLYYTIHILYDILHTQQYIICIL